MGSPTYLSELCAPLWGRSPPWPSSVTLVYFRTPRISCNFQFAGTDYPRNEPKTGKPSSFLSSARRCCLHCGLWQFPQPKREVTIMVRWIIGLMLLQNNWLNSVKMETQNVWGWKRSLEVILPNSPAQAGPSAQTGYLTLPMMGYICIQNKTYQAEYFSPTWV